MTSKAEKLRAKRGRPLKAGVSRTQRGRISRAKGRQEAPDKLAKMIRARKFGISEADAGQPAAGTVIGRLYLLSQKGGGISKHQYDALCSYREIKERYRKIIGAPDSLAVSNGGGMGDPEGSAEITIKRKLDEADRVIRECQISNPAGNIYAAIQYLVLEDQDFPHMVGDLRLVANALHKHFVKGLAR